MMLFVDILVLVRTDRGVRGIQLGYYSFGSGNLVSHGDIDLCSQWQEDIGPRPELDESYLLSGLERLVVFGVADHPAGEEPGYLAGTSVPSSFLKTMVVLSFLVEDLECQAARYEPR